MHFPPCGLDARRSRAGAWIEILSTFANVRGFESLPVRERGLKYPAAQKTAVYPAVAPRAGAWIEI